VAIGDAAHPMRPHLAQGGCQAIEDGVLLGLLLAREPDAAPAAARFAAARRRHVAGVVRNARLIGTALHAPRPVNAAFHAGNAVAPSVAMVAQLRAVASRRAFERQARRLGL
jgi:2-polyprenyl-6-methoxyphenol hydroxylase-like FAD-dependent oxidoreductase